MGIILGIVALAQSRPGKGMAIGGIVAGACGIIVVQLLVAAIMIPTVGGVRKLAQRVQCASQLNGIGMAIRMYSAENDDVLPPTLQHLIDAGQADEKHFICPSTGHSRPFDYFYLPVSLHADTNTIIACDLKGNHKEGRNVLFFDGAVQWMTNEQFGAALAEEQNAAFDKALRKAEGLLTAESLPAWR